MNRYVIKLIFVGDVAIALTDSNGRDVPVQITDKGDGTFNVDYEPKTPGTYTVMVYLAGQEIPKSPLKVTVESSIDVSKVKVVGLEPRKICFCNFDKLSPIFSLFL